MAAGFQEAWEAAGEVVVVGGAVVVFVTAGAAEVDGADPVGDGDGSDREEADENSQGVTGGADRCEAGELEEDD